MLSDAGLGLTVGFPIPVRWMIAVPLTFVVCSGFIMGALACPGDRQITVGRHLSFLAKDLAFLNSNDPLFERDDISLTIQSIPQTNPQDGSLVLTLHFCLRTDRSPRNLEIIL